MSAPTAPSMPPATSPINSLPTTPHEDNIEDFCNPEYYSLLNQGKKTTSPKLQSAQFNCLYTLS